MKQLFITLLLVAFALTCKAQDNYSEHFVAKRDRTNDFVIDGMLSDSLNKILNQLELIEVWIDYDNKKYKIHSNTNDLILEGKYYASDGGTAGYRYYCYVGDSKQKLTLSTVRCAGADCEIKDEFLEIYGGDDFYVSFYLTKRF